MANQTSHLPEGAMLSGRYRIVKFIGSGGFGCTYLADHLIFGTKVAIKEFFVSSLCNRDNTGVVSIGTESQSMVVEKLANKFLREARSLNKLSHPNIVRVSDVFVENGTNYYVMDYIEGRSLHATMYYDGPLSEARMMNYMGQIMDALEYLHSRNMLHLDIKPDNIMVDGKDRAILIDFGVAKQYGEGTNDGSSTVMGQTPGFAPLEQMSNNVKAFSAATDIYALGATMYALLTGVTPPTAPELASGVAELQPLPPYVTDNVRRTLAAMMEIKHSERLQSIAEVRAMLAGQPRPAATPGLGRQSTVPLGGLPPQPPHDAAAPADDPAPAGPDSKTVIQMPGMADGIAPRRRKKKGLLIGIIAAAALIAGLGVFALLQLTGKGDTDGGQTADADAEQTDTIADEHYTSEEIVIDDSQQPVPAETQTPAQAAAPTAAASTAGTTSTTTTTNTAGTPTAGTATSGTSNSTATIAAPVQVTTGVTGPNGHKYVDMTGSGVYWATCNLGASSPEDKGAYFAWGEVSPKHSYTEDNYELAGIQNVSDISKSQYDAATKLWGQNWRIPTNQDWKTLINNCDWEVQANGVLLTSKKTGETMFLPYSGYKSGSQTKTKNTYYLSANCVGDEACNVAIPNSKNNLTKGLVGQWSNFIGYPIRPVYVP